MEYVFGLAILLGGSFVLLFVLVFVIYLAIRAGASFLDWLWWVRQQRRGR